MYMEMKEINHYDKHVEQKSIVSKKIMEELHEKTKFNRFGSFFGGGMHQWMWCGKGGDGDSGSIVPGKECSRGSGGNHVFQQFNVSGKG